DFTEVDSNVTRHVPRELGNSDWDAMILHYLGLDHIGHKTGPQGPSMLPKQREMDGIVRMIYEAMQTEPQHVNTLLVLAGDHGMNAGGNHGGSGPGETEPALLFASPKFRARRDARVYECPTLPAEGTEFQYYGKVQQSDVVPTLAGLMGLPIPKNSLGVFIGELAGVLPSSRSVTRVLYRNAVQMKRVVEAAYGADFFVSAASQWRTTDGELADCREAGSEQDGLRRHWAHVEAWAESMSVDGEASREAFDAHISAFLTSAQRVLSSAASSYDITRMTIGIVCSAAALALAIISLPTVWPPSTAGMWFAATSVLYGVMMFASSYVEEEQHFWYWLTPAWIVLLTAMSATRTQDTRGRLKIAAAGTIILAVHRVVIRWNQTGQKHAGAADIVHGVFPNYHQPMWILILWTYGRTCYMLAGRTFLAILPTELAVAAAVLLTIPAIIFKLNFTQADAPELVQGLALSIRRWTESYGLVVQAQITFGLLGLASIVTIALAVGLARGTSIANKNGPAVNVTLTERLHHLLNLFLMTQSRAPNIPLFLGLELQRLALSILLSPSSAADISHKLRRDSAISCTELVTSTLLLSHVYFFCMGGSNSISSVDLSNAYNGVSDYNIVAVGTLLFASNWTGPIWWCSAAVVLTFTKLNHTQVNRTQQSRDGGRSWITAEREKLRQDATAQQALSADTRDAPDQWFAYVASMTVFVASGLVAVMAACTVLRTHLFIWTVFSPKYLYAMAWCVGWHLLINVGFGSLLRYLGRIA
ncbi:major facilitator super transporter protein, partial [Teratosphaeriaceae sp. CCFEE 6253]